MPTIRQRREQLQAINYCEHAGLLLDRGFKEDRGDKLHNDDKMALFAKAREITIPSLYKKAFEAWQQQQIENSNNSKVWVGKLENRLFLGMGESSPLEAGITLHHTYGVPFIPGSAIKGVLHHYANEAGLDDEIIEILFGREASSSNKRDSGEAGYIIFNDAWWVPDGKALAPEMITVHAQKYYTNKGKDAPHPDFESPNPNPHIAIQGSFLFSVEGSKEWAGYAIKLLQKAMCNWGVGGKNFSGYGYFLAPDDEDKQKANQHIEKMLNEVKQQHNIPNDNQAYASKPMAEEWDRIENKLFKQRVLDLLQNKWQEHGHFPSKKAQRIYE